MIKAISSMATREVLAELAERYQRAAGVRVELESIGGVEVARRVRAGEAFDAVVLADEAIAALESEGHVVAGTRVPLATSGVAVAVRAGSAVPDIGSSDAVRNAVLAATSIGYSTGPSGAYLVRLFAQWGIAEAIESRVVQPPPGTPIGKLVASGQVELGFQQLSELVHLPGITVVGTLPKEIQVTTTFSAGIGAKSPRVDATGAFLSFAASRESDDVKRHHGMEPPR